MLMFFKKRITNEKYSGIWKMLFFFFKYIQMFVLLYLFLNGISNLNNLKNLGYMLFFVVYTAYEEVYRKTGVLLILFNASFIMGQYLFTFVYPLVIDDQMMMQSRYKWLNLYPNSNPSTNPFNFSDGESMYFRFIPEMADWIVLVSLSLLQQVNTMYRQKEEIVKLEEFMKNSLKDENEKLIYYYGRVEKIIKSMAIYSILVFMIFIHSSIETNLINWVFFVLNLINFAFIIRGTKELKFLKQSLCITNLIKVWSLMILILDILFICFIGEIEKVNQPESLDQRFKKAYPVLYSSMDIIGFRTSAVLTSGGDNINDVYQMKLEKRFLAYIAFFLLSLYLSYYFKQQIVNIQADQSMDEQEFKKLFEYSRRKAVRNEFLDAIALSE